MINDFFGYCILGMWLHGLLSVLLAASVLLHMQAKNISYLLGFGKKPWFLVVLMGGVFGFGLYLYWFHKLGLQDVPPEA